MMAIATAYETFKTEFAAWGLPESLLVWAYDRYKELGADEMAANRVAEEMKQRPEFKARFPAFEELAKRGEAISVEEYLEYEQRVRESMKFYGVDQREFGSDRKIADMLISRVSADEAQARLELAAYGAYTAPAEVKAAMSSMYGITEGDLVSFWLEPDEALPVLRRKFGASQVAGALVEQGFGADRTFAEEVTDRGYTYTQAREAAQRARGLEGLTGGEQAVAQGDVVRAQFGDVEAQKRVERSALSRQAAFQKSSGAGADQSGVSGLGSSSSR